MSVIKNILLIIAIALTISGCGDGNKPASVEDVIANGDIAAIKEMRAGLLTEESEVKAKLKQIDAAVAELDTIQNYTLITTMKLETEEFDHFLELQGSVMTRENVVISPEIAGILSRITVKEGQRVSKGQALGYIDDGGMQQQLSQAEIQTALAKTAYERQERLWNQKIGSEMEYLQAKSTYEAQEKMVEQMQKQLDKTVIRAPFSGVVDEIITEQGNLVSPGQSPVMRIIDLEHMYVTVDVPEGYLPRIGKDNKVIVEFPVLGKKVESKVAYVGNYVDPANRTFKLEVNIENKDRDIKPNLTARLRINDYGNGQSIMIPQNILSENAKGEQYVYVVTDLDAQKEGTATKRFVETGLNDGHKVEIIKGLEAGDQVIIEGAKSVREGQLIRSVDKNV